MKLTFNERVFRQINDSIRKERGHESRFVGIAERLMRNSVCVALVGTGEFVASFLLRLPIPIYSGLI